MWAQGDDAFDIDQSYSGTISNFMGIADAESDHALEIDGPEGSMVGQFTMTNGTLKGFYPAGGEYADFRKEATGNSMQTHISITFLANLTLRLMGQQIQMELLL